MENENKNYWPGWETTKLIGHGSYASVYRIERTIPGRAEKEYAALKVITIPNNQEDIEELTYQGYTRDTITEHYRTRLDELIREYTIMLELKGHSNIVYCDDVKAVPHEDGIGWDLYIKMELLKPLKTALGNAPYDEATVIRLGRDLARALVRCKEKNILHRDIKPQNILVSRAGDFKLSDFGVAKVSEKTVSGTIAGTHEYMAPEVFRGQSYNATADIYSLGIVLYWMMNNRRTPFLPNTADIPTSSQSEDARNRRFAGEPIPRPRNGSEVLQDVVLKACAFDPQERYQSPQELLSALEALPLNPPKPAPESQPKPEGKKRSPLIPILAGAAALACLGAGLLFVRPKDPEPQPGETAAVMQTEPAAPIVIQTEPSAPAETVPATPEETAPAVTEPAAWEKNVLKADEMPEVFVYPEPIYGTDITKNQVISVTFLDTLANAPTSAVDFSEAGDGSVLAWFSIYGKDAEMYIAAEGGINGKYTRKLFINYKNLKKVSFGGNFHTDYATDMYDMFRNCSSLTEVDISSLNTANVITMDGMFSSCVALKELDLSGLETGKVTSFSAMFAGCENLKTVNMSNWDTSSAESFGVMFRQCHKLESANMSSFDTSNVTSMAFMFDDCSNLRDVNLSSFDTANVKTMEGMFRNCLSLNVENFNEQVSYFDVSSLENHLYFAPSTKSYDRDWDKFFEKQKVSGPKERPVLSLPWESDPNAPAWAKNAMKKISNGGLWTDGALDSEIPKYKVVSVSFLDTLKDAPTSSIDVSLAGDGSVLAWFSGFGDEYELFFAGEGGINAGTDCQWLFGHYNNLREVRFNGNFHTDYVENMCSMFGWCGKLKEVDISTLNTGNVTDMRGMFAACAELTDLDLRSMDTQKVKDFGAMFEFCSKLETVDMSTWDTSSAETLSWMFYSCPKINNLDFSNFDTSNVTDMSGMFYGCTSLKNFNISSFDTANVTTMEEMFAKCTAIGDLDLSHFDISRVENYNYFANQGKTVNGKDWVRFFQNY